MPQSFIIIGLNDSHSPSLSPEVLDIIARHHVFSGGLRHKEIMSRLLPAGSTWIPITVPLENVFRQYAAIPSADDSGQEAPIVVFASGDPLFFGFANTIRRLLPEAEIKVLPTFNSLQTLAHRLVMRYDDMRTVSLTGRPWHQFDRALIEHAPKIGILTDRDHTPAAIAARMMEFGYGQYTLAIGEHLGDPEKERIRIIPCAEAAQMTFEMPNCLIASWPEATKAKRYFGIPDKEFDLLDGRERMITKASIRLLSLQAMQLQNRSVLWDVGFCTGSVSIEARIQFPHLHVYAFEIRPEGQRLMHTNSRRFGAPGIEAFIGDFLQLPLDGLPQPDAVFIGGHGGHLREIMERSYQALLPGGCITFNAVTPQSRDTFHAYAQEIGLHLQPSWRIALDNYNPIEILTAIKC